MMAAINFWHVDFFFSIFRRRNSSISSPSPHFFASREVWCVVWGGLVWSDLIPM